MYLDLTPSANLFYGLIHKGYKKLTINTNEISPFITFTATKKVIFGVNGNICWVPKGTTVTYDVQSTGRFPIHGTTVVNDDMEIDVFLIVPNYIIGGSGGKLAASDDGVNWVTTSLPNSNALIVMFGGAYGGDKFYLAGYGFIISLANDGHNWEDLSNSYIGSSTLLSVDYTQNTWFATADYASVFVNGTRHQVVQVSSTGILGIAFDPEDEKLLVVGSNGRYSVSTDYGSHWSPGISGSVNRNDVTFDGTYFLAVTPTTIQSTLPSSISWSTLYTDSSLTLTSIAYGEGVVVVTHSTGVLYSSDLSTWTSVSNLAGKGWTKVRYGNGKFLAVGSDGYVTTSSDGATWSDPVQVDSTTIYRAIAIRQPNVTLTINPTPSNATVTLTSSGATQSDKSITVPWRNKVSYTVSATGYETTEGSIVLEENKTLEVELDPE